MLRGKRTVFVKQLYIGRVLWSSVHFRLARKKFWIVRRVCCEDLVSIQARTLIK